MVLSNLTPFIPSILILYGKLSILVYFSPQIMPFPSISLIIPCYNEAIRVARMFQGLRDFDTQWQGSYEVIIVDDGSTDGTDLVIQSNPFFVELTNQKKITVLQQANTGKGGALQLGVAHASKDFFLTLDADMATAPTELLRWLSMRKTFSAREVLIASRELKNSKVSDSFKRKVVGNIFNKIIRLMVKLTISDTQCGFKLYPASIAQQAFASLQTLGWAHDVEILAHANFLGYAIIEMPITWSAVEGSKIDVLRDGWKMFWEVQKISRLQKNWKEPKKN
nr:glycosyltransferase [Chitinophagaceae bacterium]